MIKNHGLAPLVAKEEAKIEKPKRVKLNHSAFLLTINSNQSMNSRSDIKDFETKFRTVCEGILSSEETFKQCLKFKDCEADFSKIKSVEQKGQVEIAPSNGYLHLHMIILISHYTRLQLDCTNIKSLVNSALGYPEGHSVYVNSTYIPYKKSVDLFSDSVILDYIEKSRFKQQ